jgi:hypothetical protein
MLWNCGAGDAYCGSVANRQRVSLRKYQQRDINNENTLFTCNYAQHTSQECLMLRFRRGVDEVAHSVGVALQVQDAIARLSSFRTRAYALQNIGAIALHN